jgi:hypothetical protein
MNDNNVYEKLLLSMLHNKNPLRSKKDNYLFGSQVEE